MFPQTKSLMDYLQERKQKRLLEEEPFMVTDSIPEEFESTPQKRFDVAIKRKRRSAILRKMLEDSGYGELAKMISIREREEE